MSLELETIDESSIYPSGSLGNNFLLPDLYFNCRKKFGYDHVFYFWSNEGIPFEDLKEGYWVVNNRPYRYSLRVSYYEVLEYQKLFYGSGLDFLYSVVITRSEIKRLLFWNLFNLLIILKIELFLLLGSFLSVIALLFYFFL